MLILLPTATPSDAGMFVVVTVPERRTLTKARSSPRAAAHAGLRVGGGMILGDSSSIWERARYRQAVANGKVV
jgi:hypothetical protein